MEFKSKVCNWCINVKKEEEKNKRDRTPITAKKNSKHV